MEAQYDSETLALLNRDARRKHDKQGVSQGCVILFRAALACDLSENEDFDLFYSRALADLRELPMTSLRNLAAFWGAGRARNKGALSTQITIAWGKSVHPTYRPQPNHSIVIVDCPAKYYY